MGLDAIIRDTTGDEPPGEQAKERDELKASLDAAREELRTLKSKEESAERELAAVKKAFAGDVPEMDDKEMMVAAMNEKAGRFFRDNNLLDAFYLYRRIIRTDPANIGALYRLAAIYYSADILDKAAECLRVILEIDPAQERAAESLREIEAEL